MTRLIILISLAATLSTHKELSFLKACMMATSLHVLQLPVFTDPDPWSRGGFPEIMMLSFLLSKGSGRNQEEYILLPVMKGLGLESFLWKILAQIKQL